MSFRLSIFTPIHLLPRSNINMVMSSLYVNACLGRSKIRFSTSCIASALEASSGDSSLGKGCGVRSGLHMWLSGHGMAP